MAYVPLFPNYMQMKPRVPLRVWQATRAASVVVTLLLCVLMFVRPDAGLFIFWQLLLPLLPLLWMTAPGLWRNFCPLATFNQTPRVFQFTRALTPPAVLKNHGYLVGISLFLLIVPARLALFNQNGPASAILILAILASAFTLGLLFKGKSGWCSSICPLLPVQRVYGQTPFVLVRNSHCNPCVGCTTNCYDFNPSVAYLADIYQPDRQWAGYRKFFAGAFPGLILAFYTMPGNLPPASSLLGLLGSLGQIYAYFAVSILISVGAFMLLESLLKVTSYTISTVFGALAINLYYWGSAPRWFAAVGQVFHVSPPGWLSLVVQLMVFALTAAWVIRTIRKESPFVAAARATEPARVSTTVPLLQRQAAQSGHPEVTFLPEERRVVVEPGRTLLEIAETNDLRIESGCRMGMCGADPVAIREGKDNLSPVGPEERSTLDRLGLAENTRMACCARVNGPVCVSLTADKRERGTGPSAPVTGDGLAVDPAIKRVVVIGNGVAGVTAADHVRRHHPNCEIHLVGRERHHLYNRMAITRLVYGRSAMQGLYLLPEPWYDEHDITTWLNTSALQIDPNGRRVLLGTGETLEYDRLILAMGSSSQVPPIEGFGLPGSFVLREAEDAMQIRAFVQDHGARHAVIAGGGLLGLEAGYALLKLGLDVSILERSDALLRRQLDERAAEFLRSYLEGLGMRIVTRAETTAVRGVRRLQEVVLKDGRTLPCDVLLVCAGIVPNVKLARDAGISVNRGIVVDDHLRTSAPNIYAVGDVAEVQGEVQGLWPSAVAQAELAAVNALGADRAYQPIVPSTILKVVGIDVLSVGRFMPKNEDDVVIVLEEPADHRYRKLVISGGRVVGAILLGYPLLAPTVTGAVKEQRDVSHCLQALRAGDWDVLAKVAA
jgi:nitrite reductase (NADH) large subunit